MAAPPSRSTNERSLELISESMSRGEFLKARSKKGKQGSTWVVRGLWLFSRNEKEKAVG